MSWMRWVDPKGVDEMRPDSTFPDSTRPELPISAPFEAGDPALMDSDRTPQPHDDDKPAATAERTWLERDSMTAPGDFHSDWAFFD
jgi:hypothetical protein